MTTARVSISGMRRHTHAIYVASWLRRLLDETDGPIDVVDLDAGSAPDTMLVRRLVGLLGAPERLHVLPDHRTRTGDHHYVAVGAPGIKPWLRLRSRTRGPVRTVVVDEGLGSHSTWPVRRAALRREGTPEPRATIRATGVTAAKRFLTDERWQLYERRAGRWAVNSRIADEFRRHRPPAAEPPTATGDVIYISQPWVEFGVVPADAYVARLRALDDALSAAGLHLRLRLHPAERPDRYGSFDVMNATGPAELDPDTVGSRLVIGDCSTGLLNLSAVLGVPTRRLAWPAGATSPVPLSAAQQSLFDTFLPPPRTIDELTAELTRSDRAGR